MHTQSIKQDVVIEERGMVRFREIKKENMMSYQNILRIAETKHPGIVENGDEP